MKNSNLFKNVLTLAILLSASKSLLSQTQRNACWTTQTGNIGNSSIYACNNGTTVATADTLFVRHAVTIGAKNNDVINMSNMAFDIISLENGATLTPAGTNNELTLPRFAEINVLAGSSIVQPSNNSQGTAIIIPNNTSTVCAWGTKCCTGNQSIVGPALLTYTDPCAFAVALPVTMVDFKGFVKNEVVNLTWLVTDEKDLSRYDIYSSVDGTNYSLCGSVSATTSAIGIKTYQFQDLSNKSALVYYRIKAMNNDETGEWSSIVALHTTKPVVNKPLKVYPNPATDYINMEFEGVVPSHFNLLVMDMSGKVILEETDVETESNEYTLSLNGFNSGMYIIKLSDECGNTLINRFSVK
jgi:hypothetical protein